MRWFWLIMLLLFLAFAIFSEAEATAPVSRVACARGSFLTFTAGRCPSGSHRLTLGDLRGPTGPTGPQGVPGNPAVPPSAEQAPTEAPYTLAEAEAETGAHCWALTNTEYECEGE